MNTENYEESEIFTKKYTVNVLGKTTISAKNTYYGTPEKAPIIESTEVDIKLELDKKDDTFVPFGIKDFENNEENQFFRFKYTLEKANLDELFFEIISSEGTVIYQVAFMRSVIIKQQQTDKTEKPKEGPLVSKETTIGSPDIEPIDYTLIGNYIFSWDGFDNNGIYDSTLFNGKTLKARVTGKKNGKQKTAEIEFTTAYSQVQWTDVKINAKTKRIDVTLRVNLTDGGAKGLDTSTFVNEEATNGETFSSKESDPFKNIKTITISNSPPANIIKQIGQPVIKKRTKTFEELKDLVVDGLAYYWGRNSKRGKNVLLSGTPYEVYVNAVDNSKNALNSLPLVYNTNGDWMRSGNPGSGYSDESLADNLLDAFPDAGVIQRLSYNVGYIYYSNGWGYSYEENERQNFQETAAHELGHELLQAYGGTAFSYQHKGSSYYFPQDTKPTKENEPILDYHRDKMPETSGENYPTSGEVDLMKYYNNDRIKDKLRTFAAEKDVLGLIWLTKLKVK